MTTTKERDQFVINANKEGLDLATIHKLLRYATTLQRLAVAQCNGDWPYNGDRDRPSCSCAFIDHQHGDSCVKEKARFDAQFTECPKCETSGVSKSSLRTSSDPACKEYDGKWKVCPDCRTQELVRATLCEASKHAPLNQELQHTGVDTLCLFKPIFNGDPRGAVLVLSTPNFPYTDDGRGRGLYVPPSRRY